MDFVNYTWQMLKEMQVTSFDLLNEATRILTLEGQAILDCAKRLAGPSHSAQFKNALQMIQRALEQGGKIVVMGVGKSGKIAQKIAATLSSTGSQAVYLHPTEALHGDLGLVSPQDIALALSYTGNTEELIRLLPSLKNLKVPVIGLGGNPDSQLAQKVDAWIDGSVDQEACPHNLAPTTSTTLSLALGDAIAIALMQLRGFDAQVFAQNHPGGSLGKRLSLTVAQVMHQGGGVATVTSTASMEEVVIISTEKKLGAVLVIEGKQLLGIITDGDIRRALKHREKFFTLCAKEIMTQNPVTARPQMMAATALELMENRPSQISVLPVVDDLGSWLGLIRLHDLIKTF